MELSEDSWVRLSARHEIENLITRYCIACDDRLIEDLVGMFTTDAYVGAMDGTGKYGIDGVREHYTTALARMGATYHWSHDRLIEVDPADCNRAIGIVQGHCEMSLGGSGWIAGIRYNDRYAREGGQWKFAWRGFQFVYFLPAERMADAMSGENRVWRNNAWQTPDLPDSLDSYKAFRAAVEAAA